MGILALMAESGEAPPLSSFPNFLSESGNFTPKFLRIMKSERGRNSEFQKKRVNFPSGQISTLARSRAKGIAFLFLFFISYCGLHHKYDVEFP